MITIRHTNGEDAIETLFTGEFLAVHKTYNVESLPTTKVWKGYTITHILTGVAVRQRITNSANAMATARYLEASFDWNFRSPNSKKWRAIRRDVYRAIAHLKQHDE